MSSAPDNLPPHYHALRLLWTVLQVALLLVAAVLVTQVLSPGDLVSDVSDWARDLQDKLF